MTKHVHLDNIVKDFINNLKVDKPIYEMSADEARDFLIEVQEKDYKDLEASINGQYKLKSPTIKLKVFNFASR